MKIPTVPAEIVTMIEQLGGQQIFAMAFDRAVHAGCGADERPDNSPRVTLHVARGLKVARAIRWVKIELDRATDTYTVTFHSWSRRAMHENTWDDLTRTLVHADQLRAVVESATGLRMTLGAMQAVRS